jgi:prophage regulatory protein
MNKVDKVEGEKTGRRILRAPAVEERTQRSRVQCWRDIKANKFPLPVQLGPNSVGWFEDEIDAWLTSRPRQMCRSPVSVTHKRAAPKPAAKKKTKPRHVRPKRKLAARPAAE